MQAARHTAEAWAGPIVIWPSAMRALEQWTDLCVANRKKRQVPRPAREDATWLVATDACRDGFGYAALNQTSGPRQFRSMRDDKLHRSVFTEPHGVLMSMRHLLQHTGRKQHVVISTDNVATEQACAARWAAQQAAFVRVMNVRRGGPRNKQLSCV